MSNNMDIRLLGMVTLLALSACAVKAPTPDDRPEPKKDEVEKVPYGIYLGNTHSHSHFSGDATQEGNDPADHFRLAREAGYDFYAVTDHSQYEQYGEAAWSAILAVADRYTDASFVGIRGYEHSENNGPGAKGHLNVYNSSTYLNALADGIDLPYFQDWICSSANSGAVVSMNHPAENQYSSFACYNESARKHVCLIELINGGKCNDYYPSYLIALSSGWKVSPVAGADNHSVNKIDTWPARTGVAAKSLTRADLLEAMSQRRTFATYEKTLKMIYYVNNHVMGSIFSSKSQTLSFEIDIDTQGSNITRVDICTAGGQVVESRQFNARKVSWKVDVAKGSHPYFFVNAYVADTETAVAYAAPVWIK